MASDCEIASNEMQAPMDRVDGIAGENIANIIHLNILCSMRLMIVKINWLLPQ